MRHCRYLIAQLGCWGVLWACAGCSGSGSSPPKGSGSEAVSSAATKTQPESVQPATKPEGELAAGTPIEGPVGSIEGQVLFTGDTIPKSTIVPNTTDPQICGMQISKRDVEISPDTKGVRYVLIWFEGVTLPEGYRPPRQDMVLDNKDCQFEPHAAAITVGSTIETTNSDNVYHTTNLAGPPATENIPLVTKGSSYKTVVRRSGTIGVKCDKHGWMQAYIRVDAHPFHAVTDVNGKFSIAGIPVGTYKLKVWHETFGVQDREVTLKEGEVQKLEVKYPVAE
jgi:plastocyanin